ncbi:MAG: hypothetical protein WBA07_25515, partial [Rivularia sp. (in: cyanobacteria)]
MIVPSSSEFMTQHQFLDRRFQEYNAALIKALENLATQLEAEKCCQQVKVIRVMLDILLEVETKNAQSVA